MLPITKLITPYNKNVKTSRDISYIVIHWVGSVSSAKNNATYFKNNKLSSSAHYFVDDTTIYQSVDDKDVAWHCGTSGAYYHSTCRNANSIGIEMCLDKVNHISDKTIANTAELVQSLMKKYNIKEGNIVRHYDVTHKSCPAPYVDAAKWSALKSILVGKVNTSSTSTTKTMTVSNKSNIAVYKTFNTDSEKLGSIVDGTKIEVQELGTVWARITYKNGKGYMHKKYLTNTMTVNVSSTLNVRKLPNASSALLGNLKANVKVQVFDVGDTWAKIYFKNDYAYVSKNYLK